MTGYLMTEQNTTEPVQRAIAAGHEAVREAGLPPLTRPLHAADHMPWVLRQMAKYDPLRRAVLNEAADHIDRLLAARADAWDEGLDAGRDRWMDAREFGGPPVNPYRSEEGN